MEGRGEMNTVWDGTRVVMVPDTVRGRRECLDWVSSVLKGGPTECFDKGKEGLPSDTKAEGFCLQLSPSVMMGPDCFVRTTKGRFLRCVLRNRYCF